MKILGISDEVSICHCCGKKNLKRTVALEHDSGEVFYYGTTCASYATLPNGKKVSKEEISSVCELFSLKNKCSNFKEFVAETKRKGYGFTIKSPLVEFHNVSIVTWCWEGIKITHKDFT
tara:strand:- start:251 stop:607 length:357 start_codon:yes stop_codon:yes gene_type:complete